MLMLRVLSLLLSVVGCGPESGDTKSASRDSSSPAGADSGRGESESFLVDQTQDVVSTEEFSWYQGGYATAMGSESDRVCYLTRMRGRFEGAGESVHAFTSGGSWYLGGSSNQNGVAASSRCAYVSSSSYTGEYFWDQYQRYPTYMGTSNGRVCFLTKIAGKFKGGGEWVHVYVSGGAWYLGGSSQQQGVSARARCVEVNSYTGEYYWSQYQGYSTYMGSSVDTSCALTYVSGKFYGAGEYVQIFDNSGSWYLGGGSLQQGVAARARCF